LQHKHRLLEITQSLCSDCGKRIPAKIVEQSGSICILKRCDTHGAHSEILEEDASYHLSRSKYDRPGSVSKPQTQIDRGCPYDCGLCPDHEQHTCVGLIEVTNACDLGCPVCYANSDEGQPLELGVLDKMLDMYVESEHGKAEILQISGGEPTLHPRLFDILDLARSKNIRYLMLNTNGLRIAQDIDFVKQLAKFTPGFEVYLQFDGLVDSIHTRLRGRPLAAIKQKAIDNLSQCGVPLTLVAMISDGVNDHEIARIVQYGLSNSNIRGVTFQPVAFFGRGPNVSTENRVTMTGVMKRLEKQSSGLFRMDDFIPLPCNVWRDAVAYYYRNNGTVTCVTRDAAIEKYLPMLDNSFVFDAGELVRSAAMGVCCGSDCDCLSFLKDFKSILPLGRNLKVESGKVKYAIENTFRISVVSFIDRFNFDMRSQQKECVHILTPDLKKIPFSAYNMLYRESYRSEGFES